jgi:glycosyltransferase involved in cell wall biosynthesis
LLRPLFDPEHYLSAHPDVPRDVRPFKHFLEVGHAEGRVTHAALEPLGAALRRRAQVSSTPLQDLAGLVPRPKALLNPVLIKRLGWMAHPDFYARQLGLQQPMSVEETIAHFLAVGVFDGLRVSAFFNEQWYLRQLAERGLDAPGAGTSPFLHFLIDGWTDRVDPTPIFQSDYYPERHPDLKRWNSWVFEHFLQRGCHEVYRKPAPWIDQPRVADPKGRELQRPLLMPRFLADPTVDLRVDSPVERAAYRVRDKIERLQSDTMRELVAKAAEIEPQVLRPYGVREVNWPPLANTAVGLLREVERARARFPSAHYDNVFLVPHCRMAGSARVTGALARALRSIAPGETTVVVTTELPTFERPDWFPDDTEVVDISSLAAGLIAHDQVRLLLDVVRGLAPTRVINVNSKLGWDLYQDFGRQLSTITELDAYLFTWDIDPRGNKGGYPIRAFQPCLPHLSTVLLDSTALRDELVWRYVMPPEVSRRLVAVYTPTDAPEHIDHSDVFARRRSEGRSVRAFWSGRFDRQKRFDVVVEIARRMPKLEIWVWGKAVLGGSNVDFDNLPPNIVLHGTYEQFDDLPTRDCDFFLYTSEWDGVPTILIDVAARGIATVASAVGGVPELVNDETGYPVADALDPGAYVTAIQAMLNDPDEATRRTKALRAHVRELCSEQEYAARVAEAFGLQPAERPLPRDVDLEEDHA